MEETTKQNDTDASPDLAVPPFTRKIPQSSGFAHKFMDLVFGSFNGVQVFLYPGLLLIWIESFSLVEVVSSLLTNQVHYIPICMFLILFIYMMFILLKNHSYLMNPIATRQHDAHLFREFAIDIHVKLMIVIISFMLMFVLVSFLKYFYGILLPIKRIFSMAVQILGTSLIMYYYVLHTWLQPLRSKGYSFNGSKLRVQVYARKHPVLFVRFTVFLIAVMVLASRIYTIVLPNFILPTLGIFSDIVDVHPHLSFYPLTSNLAVVYNVFILAAAFVVSNLFFIPLILPLRWLVRSLHPIQ